MKHLLIGILFGMLLAAAVSHGEDESDTFGFGGTSGIEQIVVSPPLYPPFRPLPPMPRIEGAPKTYQFQDLKPC